MPTQVYAKGDGKKDKSSAFRQVKLVNSVFCFPSGGKKCENILKKKSRTFAIEIHPFLIWHPWVWQYICPEGFWISSNVKSEYLWCFFVVLDSASQYFPFSEFSFYRINFRLTLQWIHIYDDYFNKTESFCSWKTQKNLHSMRQGSWSRMREVVIDKNGDGMFATIRWLKFVVCAKFSGTTRLLGSDCF